MDRKFVGYVQYSWADFSQYGHDTEIATLNVVKKTLTLAKKYDSLHYQAIKDYPSEAIVFATEPFTVAEGEAWFELAHSEEEGYVYAQLQTLLKKDALRVHQQQMLDVLQGVCEEYVLESAADRFIFRFDRILVESKTQQFVHFSIRTDKLYRWFFNE